MAQDWAIAEALLGGTRAMRAAGLRYMPKEAREEQTDYNYRLQTATLYPAFERTVGVMAGKPFSKAITLGEDVPEQLKELCEDCDLDGHNLHVFAGEIMQALLGFGIQGVLVDYPETTGLVRTLADEKNIGARPYLVRVRHNQILGWQTQKIGGVTKLMQLRLAEIGEVPDGEFGTAKVNRVRVLTPGYWELWEEAGNGEYSLIGGGTTTLNVIPFVPFYGRRLGFMQGASPLMNLAYENIKHWQHQSDQDDSTRYARKRLLVFSGLNDATEIIAGSSYAVTLPVNAKAEVVQGSAECVTVGRSELDALEQQMIQTGAELLVQKPGQRSATEANNDAEANKSDLQRIVEGFEDSLDQVLQYMADWLQLPDGGHASLYKQFATIPSAGTDIAGIVQAQQSGLLSKQTAVEELKRRGHLASEVEWDIESELMAEEGPSLGLLSDPTGREAVQP